MLHKPISKMWLLYACLLTLMTGCSKCNKVIEPKDATSSLPAATETGAGTFGCMLNGQVWLPYGRQSFLSDVNPSIVYDATYEGGALGLSGAIYGKSINGQSKMSIGMGGLNIGNTGEYNLTNSGVEFDVLDDTGGYNTKDKDAISTGKLIITKLDKTNFIIAGRFSFTIEKKDGSKKIVVTDGGFDLKYL